MDWIPKTRLQWDWETLASCSEKDCEISKPPDLKVIGSKDISNGSACSAGGGASSCSELGTSLSKGSVSASIDCSAKLGKISELEFDSIEKISGNMNKNNSVPKVEGTSSVTVSADGPKEPVIGLRLGKRTYFEDSSAGSNMKNSSSATSMPASASSATKQKISQQNLQIYCQVEGCKTDLTAAKAYHRKHRVCGIHSKSPKVIVAGQERRFCQQCSRFHDLSEFDQKKRSCRRRLSDHNARRRKPQPGTISFNSSLLSAPYYDEKQQMNLFFGRSPIFHMNSAANATWNNISGGFELRQSKGGKTTGIAGEHHFLPSALPTNTSTSLRDFDELLPYKGTTAEVLNQGISSLVGVQDTGRALSLLSSDSFGLANFGPASTILSADTSISCFTHPAIHPVDTTSGFFWQDQQHLAKDMSFNVQDDGVQFQDFQPHKTHEAFLFDSSQIH